MWWNTSASRSMTVLHISSADLLYSLYLQLMKGVAAVGVCQPLLFQISSLSSILLMAGMSLGLCRTASPLTMSASVWLSTMILMHCALCSVGFHSSFVPSVEPAFTSSVLSLSCSGLFRCGASCLSSERCVVLCCCCYGCSLVLLVVCRLFLLMGWVGFLVWR